MVPWIKKSEGRAVVTSKLPRGNKNVVVEMVGFDDSHVFFESQQHWKEKLEKQDIFKILVDVFLF